VIDQLLIALYGLKTAVPRRDHGICNNLDLVSKGLLEDLLDKPGFLDGYPYFSGSTVFPIGLGRGSQAVSLYFAASDKWSGEYGYRRYALLEYIIMKLEAMS
jgi:hypothetical protein